MIASSCPLNAIMQFINDDNGPRTAEHTVVRTGDPMNLDSSLRDVPPKPANRPHADQSALRKSRAEVSDSTWIGNNPMLASYRRVSPQPFIQKCVKESAYESKSHRID